MSMLSTWPDNNRDRPSAPGVTVFHGVPRQLYDGKLITLPSRNRQQVIFTGIDKWAGFEFAFHAHKFSKGLETLVSKGMMIPWR